MRNDKGKNTRATAAGNLAAGFKKRFTNGSEVLTFGGGARTMTVTDLTNALLAFVANRAGVTAAQATAAAKVDAEDAAMPAAIALIDDAIELVRFTFGASPEAMADFGVPLPKPRTPLTAEKKAVAAAKRLATREARGTKSPKAKKAIKGNVTATMVVTPATPEPPAPVVPPTGAKQ